MIEVTYRAGRTTMTLQDLDDLVTKARQAQIPGAARVSAETYDASHRVRAMTVTPPPESDTAEA